MQLAVYINIVNIYLRKTREELLTLVFFLRKILIFKKYLEILILVAEFKKKILQIHKCHPVENLKRRT